VKVTFFTSPPSNYQGENRGLKIRLEGDGKWICPFRGAGKKIQRYSGGRNPRQKGN
jgi:hypothetical protein